MRTHRSLLRPPTGRLMTGMPHQTPAELPSAPPQGPQHGDPGADVFRKEALEQHRLGQRDGDVLRVSPAWTRYAYWTLLAMMSIALLFAIFGRVNEYASGHAMVRATDRFDVSALTAGTCAYIEVRPGDRVVAGQVMARFYAGSQAAELEQISRAFDLLLVELLANPSDPSPRHSLAQLRTQRELARSRLEEQSQRAPAAGVVEDVRVRPGEFVQAGEVTLTMRADSGATTVVGLLPGRFGPELHPGMDMRVEFDGYPHVYQQLKIISVSNEVLGVTAARRILGRDAADGLNVTEPVLVVTATLPSRDFRAHGKNYVYHDGMHGRVQVKTRSQSILFSLIPNSRDLAAGTRD